MPETRTNAPPVQSISYSMDALEEIAVAESWNAGHMGCGEVLILLRKRMQPLAPGLVFKLTTYDLGAHEDIPAWCRLTERRLLKSYHPHYWIQQK